MAVPLVLATLVASTWAQNGTRPGTCGGCTIGGMYVAKLWTEKIWEYTNETVHVEVDLNTNTTSTLSSTPANATAAREAACSAAHSSMAAEGYSWWGECDEGLIATTVTRNTDSTVTYTMTWPTAYVSEGQLYAITSFLTTVDGTVSCTSSNLYSNKDFRGWQAIRSDDSTWLNPLPTKGLWYAQVPYELYATIPGLSICANNTNDGSPETKVALRGTASTEFSFKSRTSASFATTQTPEPASSLTPGPSSTSPPPQFSSSPEPAPESSSAPEPQPQPTSTSRPKQSTPAEQPSSLSENPPSQSSSNPENSLAQSSRQAENPSTQPSTTPDEPSTQSSTAGEGDSPTLPSAPGDNPSNLQSTLQTQVQSNTPSPTTSPGDSSNGVPIDSQPGAPVTPPPIIIAPPEATNLVPSGGFELPNGETLAPGSQTTVSSTVFSLSPDTVDPVVVIGASTISLIPTITAFPLPEGISVLPGTEGIMLPNADSLTLGGRTTISGTEFAFKTGTDGPVIVVGTSTVDLPPPFTVLPSGGGIVLEGGATLSPGVVTTIEGVTVSVASDGSGLVAPTGTDSESPSESVETFEGGAERSGNGAVLLGVAAAAVALNFVV